MNTHRLLSFVLLFACSLGCQKSFFKKVTVTGRLIEKLSQQPLTNTWIALYADDATSAKNSTENTIQLVSGSTDDAGYFKLSSAASKRGTYYIRYSNARKTAYVNGHAGGFSLPQKAQKDLGDVIAAQ